MEWVVVHRPGIEIIRIIPAHKVVFVSFEMRMCIP